MALRSRDREFWVWDFEKRVWMFEEGEEEGRKNCLGTVDGERQKIINK